MNRDSPSSKVIDFYERAQEVIFQLEFYQEARKYLDAHLPSFDFFPGKKPGLLRRLRQQLIEFLPQSGVQKLEDTTLLVSVCAAHARLSNGAACVPLCPAVP